MGIPFKLLLYGQFCFYSFLDILAFFLHVLFRRDKLTFMTPVNFLEQPQGKPNMPLGGKHASILSLGYCSESIASCDDRQRK